MKSQDEVIGTVSDRTGGDARAITIAATRFAVRPEALCYIEYMDNGCAFARLDRDDALLLEEM